MMNSRTLGLALGAALVLAWAAPPAIAQPAVPETDKLTLAEALELGTTRSELVDIARAGEARADAERLRVRSQRLPQVGFIGAYSRTLASEFSDVFQSGGPLCAPLAVDAALPLTDRVAEIERAAGCGAILPDLGFENLPFGQANIYQTTFSFSQLLYSGGRVSAEAARADFSRRAASTGTTSTQAEVALDVTRAFFDAALSDRLVAIAELADSQASAAYELVRLAFAAGRQPEFELLRAQVARDNQQPVVIRARSNREIAYLRLRQLLKIPRSEPLVLDVDLDDALLPPPPAFADALAEAKSAGPSAERASIVQAEAVVGLREADVRVARAERLPSVSLVSSLGQVGYPSQGSFPRAGDFRTNWSLGAAVQLPLLTGGRIKASEASARADLAEAEARLRQTRVLSLLDAATALEDLSAAEATLKASTGTVEQAERAYQIADLRNREGLSTQLELSDSRLSLQVAQANRARAARDVQVARARVALLPNLPVGAP
jgi:outer membrane protein TolC